MIETVLCAFAVLMLLFMLCMALAVYFAWAPRDEGVSLDDEDGSYWWKR